MTSKKKLAISISALCIIVLAVVVSVVAVLAARNAKFTGSFQGGYTANHVDATITGEYKVGANITDTEGWTALTTSADDNTIKFTSDIATGSDNATQSFNAVSNITLKSTDNVIFKYTITNDSDSVSFTVVGDQTGTFDNLKVAYSYKTTTADVTSFTVTEGFTVAAGSTVTVYVVITIDDADSNATFNGAVNWTLTAIE